MLSRRNLLLVLLALALLASFTVQAAARRTLEVWIMQTGNPAGGRENVCRIECGIHQGPPGVKLMFPGSPGLGRNRNS